jgi:hypothetical protein
VIRKSKNRKESTMIIKKIKKLIGNEIIMEE